MDGVGAEGTMDFVTLGGGSGFIGRTVAGLVPVVEGRWGAAGCGRLAARLAVAANEVEHSRSTSFF